jgi:hypothetical protein
MKKDIKTIVPAQEKRRMNCACASCQCTVDMDTAVRKGNLLYCSQQCMAKCTPEQCTCEHDHCAM